MKKPLLFLILILLLQNLMTDLQAQDLNKQVVDSKGRVKLLGKVDKLGLTAPPFNNWFAPQYEKYEVDSKAVEKIRNELKDHTIKVFIGTWCGDSRREIPRFYKVLEAASFPMDQLMVIAVDNERPNYKKSPGGEEQGLRILKVPTFIFYEKGREVNRIIEFPVSSLEQDMEAILVKGDYKPNYSQSTEN